MVAVQCCKLSKEMAQTSKVLNRHRFETNPDSFQVHKQTPSSSTCQCYVVQLSILVMDALRQVQLDRGPCLKHTSIPNQHLFVRVRVTNLLSVKLHL